MDELSSCDGSEEKILAAMNDGEEKLPTDNEKNLPVAMEVFFWVTVCHGGWQGEAGPAMEDGEEKLLAAMDNAGKVVGGKSGWKKEECVGIWEKKHRLIFSIWRKDFFGVVLYCFSVKRQWKKPTFHTFMQNTAMSHKAQHKF